MPFTYLRAYATELCTTHRAGGPRGGMDGDGPSSVDRPEAGAGRLPAVTPRSSVDVEIEQSRPVPRPARLADPPVLLRRPDRARQGPGDLLDLPVRTTCLARAIERDEPYGVWGGEVLISGRVAEKRARGRPARRSRPRLVVDEVTGVPIVA